MGNPHGTFAEYATCPAHTLAALPASISFEDAAALPCAGLTAYQIIHRKFHLRQPASHTTSTDATTATNPTNKSQSVFIAGAGGGVGTFAVQLAKAAGMRVLATCSAASEAYVRSLGADDLIDYTRDGDVAARVRTLTNGRGVEFAVDCVSSESATTALTALAWGGELACVSGAPARLPNFWLGTHTHPSNGRLSFIYACTCIVLLRYMRTRISKIAAYPPLLHTLLNINAEISLRLPC